MVANFIQCVVNQGGAARSIRSSRKCGRARPASSCCTLSLPRSRKRTGSRPWTSRADAALRARLTDWKGLLTRHVRAARQILAKLIPDRLVFTPHVEGDAGYYRFTGAGRIEPLLQGLVALPTPTGAARLVRQVWWPQRDFLSGRVSASAVSGCRGRSRRVAAPRPPSGPCDDIPSSHVSASTFLSLSQRIEKRLLLSGTRWCAPQRLSEAFARE